MGGLGLVGTWTAWTRRLGVSRLGEGGLPTVCPVNSLLSFLLMVCARGRKRCVCVACGFECGWHEVWSGPLSQGLDDTLSALHEDEFARA